MANKKIIIAGGGTGGHIFPAIAIANAIKAVEPATEILFVGAKDRMEMEKVPEAGYKIEGLDIAGFNRSSLIKNIGLPIKLIKSFFQVRRIMIDFKPDAVIGVGGYSSFPVLRYAQQREIPTFIHESNSLAGKTNILLGKKATQVFTASSGMNRFFPEDKIRITGNPVRSAIAGSTVTREEGIRYFGLDPEKKTVLAIGGSLGANSINEAIDAGIGVIESNGLQLIWQTGKPYAGKAAERAVESKSVWVNAFITEMQYAYAAADLVISRAGAMAIAELCVMKKAVVFVPFPFAAEDHQTVNAKYLVEKNAALMVSDQNAKALLVNALIELAGDEAKQNVLKNNIGQLAVEGADREIATSILNHINAGIKH